MVLTFENLRDRERYIHKEKCLQTLFFRDEEANLYIAILLFELLYIVHLPKDWFYMGTN